MVRVFALIATLNLMIPAWVSAADYLPKGGKLGAGERLTSSSGHFCLVMQGDGNLVLYQGTTALWNSETCASEAASCSMQGDGNLVVYGTQDAEYKALWASDTSGCPDGRLVCQDDGNLVIYQNGKAVWASNTSEKGQALLKVVVAFKLILGAPEKPNEPKPKPPAPRLPTSGPKAPSPKPPSAAPPISSGWRLLRYGKWLVRIGGKLVPYVGWAMIAYECGILLYEGGVWVYHALGDSGDEPDADRGVIAAIGAEPGMAEAITPISVSSDTIALLFPTGFLSADVGADMVVANRRQIGECEKFRVTRHENGSISLLALSTGKYLSANAGGGAGVTADAEKVGPSEKFTPEVVEDKLYLRAAGGQYLGARSKP